MMKKPKLRKYLYEEEIVSLLQAVKTTRHSLRNTALLLLLYIHAYRTTEICNLKWDDIDLKRNKIVVKRTKGGVDFTHDISMTEKILLEQFYREKKFDSPFVFVTDKGYSFTRQGIYSIVTRLNKISGIDVWVHTHMLRHSKGFNLRRMGKNLEDIRDYMGHKHIATTEIYTRMVDNAFTNINEGSIFI